MNPILALLALPAALLLGGLAAGVDRKITARIQRRTGPPIWQPLLDLAKLLGKGGPHTAPWQAFCAVAVLTAAAGAMLLLLLGGDLLLVFFVQAAGAVFLVIGALAAPSPYSQAGGQRELLVMLAYEPLLMLAIVGLALASGSFRADEIMARGTPLLPKLPLAFLALAATLAIKLRKSPFDVSASHHAHQELVRGLHTEFSGPALAALEAAHWLEVMLLGCLCALFWPTGPAMLLPPAAAYSAAVILDNASARLSWRWTLAATWTAVLVPAALNIAWLAWAGPTP